MNELSKITSSHLRRTGSMHSQSRRAILVGPMIVSLSLTRISAYLVPARLLARDLPGSLPRWRSAMSA
jgi:hypothetical protein